VRVKRSRAAALFQVDVEATHKASRICAGPIEPISLVNVVLPTRADISIRKRCVSHSTDHQAILLQPARSGDPHPASNLQTCSEDLAMPALKTNHGAVSTTELG